MEKKFTGQHFPAAVTRTYTAPDPANPGRNITTRKKLDLITGLQIERVSGHGHFTNTNEPFVTLSGQYAPAKTARITASSQNAQIVRESAVLKGNVDTTNEALPLKSPVTVEAIVSPMRGYGFLIEELYLVKEDGSKETIIGAPESAQGESTQDMFL